jgi:hypothetical protein
MKHIANFQDWLNEQDSKSGEVLKPQRGVTLQFDPKKHPELAGEMFGLISTAYAELGGHAKIQSAKDVFADPDWNFWEGVDIHGTDDFDLIMFGQKTRYGVKYSGVGHDGSSQAKRKYIANFGDDLKKLGFYVEASGKLASILIKDYRIPTVDSKAEIEKAIGKDVEFVGKNPEDPNAPGDAWYVRTLGGHKHAKIMLGRPKV